MSPEEQRTEFFEGKRRKKYRAVYKKGVKFRRARGLKAE
jgi:hypothetical protein